MNPIRMVDLVTQYGNIQEEIDAAVLGVMKSAAFINGPEVTAFQQNLEKYLGVKHVIPCANGTDALQVSMMALELKPGDEVITTSFTFIATAEVIALLGLTPVVVDVDPDTFNIDPNAIRRAITPKTKAIVPVHLFGQCADMEEIQKIADEFGLFVIEDACQSIGADYIFKDGSRKKSGTISNIGCTSFFPSKNLGCFGDGGAIFTNDDSLAEACRSIANHGMVVRYYHDRVGVNSRLDSIQAAILRVKLKYLDNYISNRQNAARAYNEAFADFPQLQTPQESAFSTHVFHQYTLLTTGFDRNKLQEYLAVKDVPSMIYYPVPMHLQKAYTDPRYKDGDFPITESLSKSVISLPMHTELSPDQIDHITQSVIAFIKSNF
ncbi:MAG: DegT/DnrJ/EryC1/StrS family aminotransferase [Bacteroidetes bacterium]|nr:DegT/DnrJ/EryC1/StrS family aminotransferase [Bacteroidota bacterium]MBU1719977.1 DegT/DnrJ/EryC1/StrS family aminotransferase [Bacteroidota bacterium]